MWGWFTQGLICVFLEGGCLVIMCVVAAIWARAGIKHRFVYNDELTLIGGAIWSQIITNIGLIVSEIFDQDLAVSIKGYFIVIGSVILLSTGAVLIYQESKNIARRKQRQRRRNERNQSNPINTGTVTGTSTSTSTTGPRPKSFLILQHNKIYITIGTLISLAGAVTTLHCILLIYFVWYDD